MMAPQNQQEEDLVRRVQDGDDGAFDRLVELCAPRVYSLAYRMVGNSEDAQDIAQEAFVRAYQALPRFRQDASFTTWLHRIVANVCHDELSRRRRRPQTFSEMTENDDSPSPLENETTGDTPETQMLSREREEALQHALAQLPEVYRMAVVLHDVQGMDYREMAAVLRTELGTVKSRLNRGRTMLQNIILQQRELYRVEASQSI